MTRVAIAGIAGQMGRSIVPLVANFPTLRLVGGTVRPGTDLRTLSIPGLIDECNSKGHITERLEELLDETDVVVDFTGPDATMQNVLACVKATRAIVVGTTGLDQNRLAELREIGAQIPVFCAPNMSLGMAVLHAALPILIDLLDGYDVEIIEMHHRHKVDAPSGTALGLADSVAAARGNVLEGNARFGRVGTMPRQQGEIGVHAVRAGGNVGEHELILANTDEQVTIGHRAFSRAAYARGALHAVTFLAGREPGYYTMADLVAQAGGSHRQGTNVDGLSHEPAQPMLG